MHETRCPLERGENQKREYYTVVSLARKMKYFELVTNDAKFCRVPTRRGSLSATVLRRAYYRLNRRSATVSRWLIV